MQELWFLCMTHSLMYEVLLNYLLRFSSYRGETILWQTQTDGGMDKQMQAEKTIFHGGGIKQYVF